MRSRQILGAAMCASLLMGATACGDDDDDAAATTTTTAAEGPTAIEVTLTTDGIDGLPSELPAGLVEITLVNESGAYGSLDISRVTAGTTEDDFVDGLAPVFEGGEFPEFFESNVGVEVQEGETATALVTMREGDHIAWFEVRSGDDDEGEEEPETETETETVTESESESEDTSTTVAGEDDDTTTSTSAPDETTTSTTTATDEEGAAPAGQPTGTLTAVAAEDEPDESESESEGDAPDSEGSEDEDGGSDAPEIVTAALTVTAGDDAAELPEADGEIIATDYEFEATLDGPGTINFRNDGPQQFHHAVVMDFGTNDPDAVEAAFPSILESEGDPSAQPDVGGLDMDQVDFEFGGAGVFGPDGVAGTFEADFTEGNTYVLACFLQDRTGGPPHAVAYDMWQVVQVGGGTDSTTTTDG